MAVVIVNTLLIVSLYLGFELLKRNSNQSFPFFFSLLFGFSIFVGNLFRPLFYVLLIAEIISLLLYIFSHPQKLRQTTAVILVVLIFALVPGKIYYSQFKSIGDFDVPDSKVGWNFFVGANYDSMGKWSPEDNYYFWCELIPQMSPSEAEDILFKQGIQRYMAMNPSQLFSHITNKLSVLFADVGNAIRDLKWTFQISEKTYNFLSDSVTIFYWFLISFVFLSCLSSVQSKHNSSAVFLSVLTFIGFSMAYMLVEVMNRYSSMLVALLIVITGLQISDHTQEVCYR